MSQRKAFPLRLDPVVHEALQRWADAELRSVNAQIEFILRRACQKAGRLRPSAPVSEVMDPDVDLLVEQKDEQEAGGGS